ncbi:zona pellucida sperm-binding protein 4-like isoform X1 [Sebastes fasciatus]|uniref:zona pellucida sperm-binding protein 4-like isoform X1 n=1 Tax=Sebastes fasciatus TaxID=394691 RepID=UPI003D9E9085
MKAHTTNFILVTLTSLSLLLLKREAHAAHSTTNDASICHDGFMSVYISKVQFAALPLAIYVQDEHGGYYQAIAVAKQCHYFLGETDTLIIFTVASHGCFVRRQKYLTDLTVVIVALADGGRVEIVKSIPLICEREIKEVNKPDNPVVSFCNKDGFNITILQNAMVPPLNLDAVWIPSSQNHNCKPKTRSKDAVTFSFPFTDCGTHSVVILADGIITYWVNVEVKQHPQKGAIFRDSPFRRTVHCSFALAQITQLGITVQGEKHLSTLKSEGILRTEMRFAKDSSYKSFYSSRDPPAVTELGQPVHVEVFVLKHKYQDLVLLLEDCWATPTKNPHDPLRWNLLVKGCPFSGDSHRTAVLPVVPKELKYPSLHKWFVVKMFSFVKPTTFENLVYFHCDIEICKGPGCLQSCSSNGRRTLRRITPEPGQRILHSVVSGGPLLYLL